MGGGVGCTDGLYPLSLVGIVQDMEENIHFAEKMKRPGNSNWTCNARKSGRRTSYSPRLRSTTPIRVH